jgi:hypothetical protein
MNVSIELLNQILGYLGTRPYQEVFQLINAIQDVAKQSTSLPIETETPQE